MKKAIFLTLISAVLASCAIESTGPESGDSVSREVDIKLSTGNAAMTRAVLDETINTVEVLVFDGRGVDPDDATFQYSRYAWERSGGVYNTTLMVGTGLDIYFAINAGEIIANAALVKDVTKWKDVRTMLVMDGGPDAMMANNLPMWGYKHDVTLSDVDNNNLNVQLMRSVAGASVEVTTTNFALEKAYVAYGIDKGYLAFDHANTQMVENVPRIKTPTVPAGAGTVETGTWSVPHTQNKVENSIYLYENDFSSDATGTVAQNHTKIILSGRYNNGQTTYYPLSLRNAQTGKKVVVARNRKYSIKVTKVNGDGYNSLEDAEKGEDLNINYEVIEWDNDWDDDDILVDGVRYISLSPGRNSGRPRQAVMFRNAGSTDEIKLETNIPLDQITLSLIGAPDTATGPDAVVESDRYRVKLVEERNTSGIHYCRLVFTALQDYTIDENTWLTFTAGRIQSSISVSQRNANPDEDWIEGGDNQETLGR